MTGPGRRRLRLAAVALLGAVGAWLSLGVLPSVPAEVGPGRVAVHLAPGWVGRTTLAVPPLGQLSARTHRAPLQVRAEVTSVEVAGIGRQLRGHDPAEALRREATRQLGGIVVRLGLEALAGAVLAGLLVGVVVPRRSWRTVAAGTAGALALLAGTAGATAASFDASAFDAARFTGPVTRLTALVQATRGGSGPGVSGAVSSRLQALAAQVDDAYGAVGGAAPVGPDEVTVLHVSDIHSNPVGVALTDSLAQGLHVDAVLDTGDLTSFGMPVETELVAGVSAVGRHGIPYLLVPGNHDAPAVRRRLGRLPGVRLLDGEVATVGSGADAVRILGVGDPTFTADGVVSTAQARATKSAAAPAVLRLVMATHPAVLAVHDPAAAVETAGAVPLVVAGHLHRRQWSVRQGTVFATVGSTGSGGIAAQPSTGGGRFEAEVLRFSRGRLVAVDYLVLHGSHGQFDVDRTVVGPGRREAATLAAGR